MFPKDTGRRWAWAGLLALATSVPLAGCRGAPEQLQVSPTRAYVDARAALLVSADDPDPRVRTNAIEALAATEGLRAGGVYMQSLRDDRLPVVAAAAMAVGETRYEPARPVLEAMAADPRTPPKLMCSVIYALHRLGNDVYTQRLGGLLRDEDMFVRAEAARVMGKMGRPSAIGPLKALQRDDREAVVRLNVAEALALLGDEQSLGLLEAFTKSQMLEDRLIAVQALGKLRHMRAVTVLRRVGRDREQSPLVRVAAIGSLASLGERENKELVCWAARDPRGVLRSVLGRRAQIETRDAITLQTLAIGALEKMDNQLDVNTVYPLLRAERGPVKVASARAVLRLLRDYSPRGGELEAAATSAPAPAETADAPPEAEEPATQPIATTERPTPQPKLHSSDAKD